MADIWYAVVDGSGDLISVGTVIADADTLTAQGYSAIALSGDPTGQVWNSGTKTFSPAPVALIPLSTWAWISRFTPAEYGAIAASTDPAVKQFLLMVTTAQTILPSDPVVQNGINYLLSLGLLTADRAAVIGAN